MRTLYGTPDSLLMSGRTSLLAFVRIYTARGFQLAFPPLFSDGRLRLHWCDLLIQILQQCLVCCTASGTDQ